MSDWKCSNCGYTLNQDKPPEACPSCRQKCEFLDVTCYVPQCGGATSGNIDPRLGRKP